MYRVGVGGLKLTTEDKALVNKVLDSNRLSYGKYSREFEQRFAQLHDSKHAVFSNSGTSALHIALAALKQRHKWLDGDEVIVPSVTFVATANVVLHNNLRPVFADVEPETFNISPMSIAQHLSDRTRAIIPVHLLGLPASMDPIMRIAHNYGLKVVEDSAETMFARYKGRSVGSFGDIGCFSTYVAHYIVTGVGGLNTTSDPNLAVRLRSLANHGRDSIYLNIDDRSTNAKKQKEIISRRFHFTSLGHSFRATEMEAALGVSQLRRHREIKERRVAIASMYKKGLADLVDRIGWQVTPLDRDNAYMLFGIVDKSGDKRRLVDFLESSGIETRDLLPLINQPVYRNMYFDLDRKYPVAAYLNKAAFYIGCHQYISDADVRYVIRKFHEFYKR